MDILKLEKSLSFNKLQKMVGVKSYRWFWELVRRMEKENMVGVYKSKHEKGRPLMISKSPLYEIISMAETQMRKIIRSDIRKTGESHITNYKFCMENESKRVNDYVNHVYSIILREQILNDPNTLKRYDIILRSKNARRKKTKRI